MRLILVPLIPALAAAGPIQLADIASPQSEGFETIINNGVPGDLAGGAFGDPPAGYVHPSGLSLLSPDPNRAYYLIGDFTAGDAAYGLGTNGLLASPDDLRAGPAYACIGIDYGAYRFRLPAPTDAWGIFASTHDGAPITLRSYDQSGALIDEHTFPTTDPVPLTDRHFIGLGGAGPVAYAEIEADAFFLFDELTWNGDDNCGADIDHDGDADAEDFFAYLDAFAGREMSVCDTDGDGDCDAEDLFGYLDLFAAGC